MNVSSKLQPGSDRRVEGWKPGGSRWWIMEGNRWLIATILSIAAFVMFVIVGLLDPIPLREAIMSKDPIESLHNGLIGGVITGVTLVLTINQLVLSQELGAVGDQRQRMERAMSFIRDVEAQLDKGVSSAEPAAFLESILDGIRGKAMALYDAESNRSDGNPDDRILDYSESLIDQVEETRQRLEGASFGSFNVISAALHFDYSRAIHTGRNLRESMENERVKTVEDEFEQLLKLLQSFGPTREHFKTLFFQWELINLSHAMVYTGLPALIISCGTILYLDDLGSIAGQTLGMDNLILTISLLTALAISPFMVLTSFVLRITSVAKNTLAMGPFVLQQ